MKRILFTLLAALPLSATACAVGAETDDRMAMTIILDTSWSCGNDLPEFRTLTRQGFGGLDSGDCVEILTAHPGRSRLRLAQTTYQNTASQISIVNRVLTGIHEGFLSDAKVSGALATALDRLKSIRAKQDCQKAVVVILSDGHLANTDVEDVLKLAAEFRQRGWPLYITGDRNANRNLLMAGNRGHIDFVPIGDANPALWLREARASLRAQIGDKSTASATQAGAPAPSTQDGTSQYTPSGPSDSTLERSDLGLASGRGAPRQDIRTRTEVEVTISDGSTRASADQADSSPPKRISVSSAAAQEPNESSEEAVKTERVAKQGAPSGPKRPVGARVKHWLGRFWPWLLAGAGALLLTAIGYWLARDGKKAREIRTIVQGYLRTKISATDRMVVVTVNGQTRHLGRLSRLRPFYIGSGAKNALRIAQKGISARHLCLYQKAGRLMLRNLSGKPIAIEGRPIEPKAKRSLTLPVVIELAQNVKLRVALAQPKPTGAERSEEHGQTHEIPEATPAVSR